MALRRLWEVRLEIRSKHKLSGDLILHPTLRCELCGFVKYDNVSCFHDMSRAEVCVAHILMDLSGKERAILAPIVQAVATPEMCSPHFSIKLRVKRCSSRQGLREEHWHCVERLLGKGAEESE